MKWIVPVKRRLGVSRDELFDEWEHLHAAHVRNFAKPEQYRVTFFGAASTPAIRRGEPKLRLSPQSGRSSTIRSVRSGYRFRPRQQFAGADAIGEQNRDNLRRHATPNSPPPTSGVATCGTPHDAIIVGTVRGLDSRTARHGLSRGRKRAEQCAQLCFMRWGKR